MKRPLLTLLLFLAFSYFIVTNIFSGYNFVYTQDTFLQVKPKIQSLFYVWKDFENLGKAYLNHGYWFYFFATEFFEKLGFSFTQTEFFYLFLLIFLSQMSIFYTILRVFNLKMSDLDKKELAFLMLHVLVYIFNAYNLTVTFYLIENWTAYAIIVPLSFTIIYDIVAGKRAELKRDYLIFLIISIVFSYGFSPAFLIATLYAATILYFSYTFLKNKFKGFHKALGNFLLLILLFLLAGLPHILVNEATLGLKIWDPSTLFDPQSLYRHMWEESSTTSLLNVFTFQGFVWLNMPYLFPWYYNATTRTIQTILVIFGWCLIYWFSLLIKSRENKVFFTSWSITLVILMYFMKTLQPPLGEILYYLVLTHIPIFYIFINPYYFLGQWLVLGYVLMLAHVTLGQAEKLGFKWRFKKVLGAIFLIVFISYWISMLFSGMVYPNPNVKENTIKYAHSINIPEDLLALNSIIESNARVLFLPPTIQHTPVLYWTFDNRTIIDVGTFRYSIFDFTPLFESEVNWLALKYIEQARIKALTSLLRLFGIRYIVLNRYAEINLLKNGINLSQITETLDTCNSFVKIFVSKNEKLIVYKFLDDIPATCFLISQLNLSLCNPHPCNNRINAHIASREVALRADFLHSNIVAYLMAKDIPIIFSWNDYQSFDDFIKKLILNSVVEREGTILLNKSESAHLIPAWDLDDNIAILLMDITYEDLESKSWKNIILDVNETEIYLQIFSDYTNGVAAFSLQKYDKVSRKIIEWANVNFRISYYKGHFKICILITSYGVDAFLFDENQDKLYFNYMPLQETISLKNLSLWVNCVGTQVVINYKSYVIKVMHITSDDIKVFVATRMEPTRWIVKIYTSKPFIISFAESYDPLWFAYVNGERIQSIPLYDVINGFWINQTGLLEISIEYEPQKWFYMGSIISASTLIACITYLIYDWIKKKDIVKRIKKRVEAKTTIYGSRNN
ncbi:MAG: hypothetical protein QXF61_10090 [Nitrososphaeria archaeon]